ncbi:MAG: YihY/virulence factor BrkB family protein [Cyclobacteriaceae bacterium]|nr:YihY/virulence factor BrkB family protein [Cyclobacteriaceae bacterium]
MKIPYYMWWQILKDTVTKFFNDNPFQYSATIAYYTILSLPGIAIISVMIASSFFFEDNEVRNELIKQTKLLMGESSAEQIESVLSRASISEESNIMKIIGAVTLVISATTVFVSLQDSLNYIWRIRPKPKKFFVRFLLNRLLSLAMVVSIGFLILVSLMADTLIALLRHTISDYLPGFSYYIFLTVNILFSLGIILLVFASIYKVLPDAQIKWKDVWIGAIVTTIFFTGGKYLISYYLSTSSFSDVYGAAGSLVLLLVWVYYSVLILFFGAEFTYVYTKHKGRIIKPDKNAVGIKIEEIEKGNLPVN